MQRLIVSFYFTLFSLSLWAAQCAIDPLAAYTTLGGDASDSRLHVVADSSEGDFNQAVFTGEVSVQKGDKHLFAPKVDYSHQEATLIAQKGIVLGMPSAAIRGEEGKYEISNQIITFGQSDYYLSPKANNGEGSKGTAKNAVFNQRTHIDQFQDVSWTTCNRDKPVWQIKANAMTLDHNTNRGVARDMTFNIANTPIFWLPYFSFPITDARATGFLMPSFASSEARGIEAVFPFYWNIAPNQDATFALHPMTKRGIMVDAEYRFMTEKQYGLLRGAWLPQDREHKYKSRWQIGLEHDYQFNPSWKTEIRYQQVSDINYLEDIDNGLTLYDEWYLDRYAKILGNGNWGNLMVQLQSYERVSPEVDEANTPYDRLPQIVYHKDWQTGQFHYGITTEAVRFYKSSEGNANRFSANAEVNYRLSKSYGYLEPKLTVNARRYDFHPDNHAFREGQKTLVIPSLSLDGSLIFERGINIEGSSFTQTLEPRLFYLYTPYKAQSDIPLFDTADLSKSWHWLFARNRFSGGDRIGDANQLTTAVTTRFYRNSDGQEKLRLSLGQIQYFADRKLQLYGNAVTNTSKSVIVTEGNYQIDRHWSLYGLSFWDPNKHRNDRNVLDLRYHLDTNRYLQLGHYYNRDDYNQLSLGIGWRLNPNWRVFARQDYSLRERQGFNTMAAIEYNDCCWAWRLAGRHYRNKPEDQTKHNAVYLEFIFKGLGNMGSSTGSLLKNQLNQFTPLPQERTL